MHPLTTALAILVAVNGVVCGPLLGLPGLSDVSTPSVAMTVSIGGSGSNKESAGEGSEDTSSVRGASHWISSGRSEAADINQQGKEGSYSNVDHWISGLQDFLKKGASAVGAETSDWKARLNEYIRTSEQPKEDTASIVDPGHWTGGVTELLGTQRKESTSHELGGGSWNTGHKESIGVSEQHQEGTLSASNPISLNADHVGSRSTSEIRHIGTTVDSSPTSWNAGHKDSIVISERRNEDTRSDPNPVTRREGQKESVSITEHRVEGSSLETHPASTWSAGPKESVVTEHQNKEESAFNVGRKDSTGVQETRESVSHFDSGSHVQSRKLAFGKRDKDSSDSSESSSKPRRRPGFGISTDQERGKESSVLEYVPVQKHTAQQPLRESSDGHYDQTQEASQSQIISYSSKRDDEASESRDPRRGTGETTEQSSGRSTSSSSSSIYRQSYPGANQQSGVGSEGRYGQPQGGSRGGYESISSRGRDDEASEGRDTGRRTGETAPSISAGSSISSSSSRQSYTGSSLQRGENPQAVYDQAQQGGRGEYQSSSSWRREEGPSEGRDTQRGEGETTRSSSSYSSSTSVERSQSYPNSESRTDGIQRIRDPSDGNANLASSSQSYTAQEGRAVVVRGREEPSTNDGYVSSTVTKSSVASSVEGGRRTAVAPIQERDSGLISTEGFSKTLNGNGEYKSANPELALSVPLPLGGTTSLSLDMGKVDPGHDIIQWDANLHW